MHADVDVVVTGALACHSTERPTPLPMPGTTPVVQYTDRRLHVPGLSSRWWAGSGWQRTAIASTSCCSFVHSAPALFPNDACRRHPLSSHLLHSLLPLLLVISDHLTFDQPLPSRIASHRYTSHLSILTSPLHSSAIPCSLLFLLLLFFDQHSHTTPTTTII